jgi:hypothetical protein
MCQFFFSHLKRIRWSYREFFETESEEREVDTTTEEDTPQMSASESAARFFFELTFQLCGEDISKYERINETNLYLALNTASLLKERAIKQQNELKKLEAKNRR